MNYNLQNKHVLVTGGAKGLGLAIAKNFVAQNAKVTVFDLSIDTTLIEQLEKENIHSYASVDVSDFTQLSNAISNLEPIDILINNAGIYPTCELLDMSISQWQYMMNVNLNSVFYCTQLVAKKMIKNKIKGSIVNITTIDSFKPSYGHSHYAASKAAVYSFTLSSAAELGKYGIRVNAVAPGLINRPTLKTDWPDGYNRFLDKAAIQSVPEADDIAQTCVFLASDVAKAISGVEIPVDSGVLTAAPY